MRHYAAESWTPSEILQHPARRRYPWGMSTADAANEWTTS